LATPKSASVGRDGASSARFGAAHASSSAALRPRGLSRARSIAFLVRARKLPRAPADSEVFDREFLPSPAARIYKLN